MEHVHSMKFLGCRSYVTNVPLDARKLFSCGGMMPLHTLSLNASMILQTYFLGPDDVTQVYLTGRNDYICYLISLDAMKAVVTLTDVADMLKACWTGSKVLANQSEKGTL